MKRLLLFLLLCVPAFATNYYVRTDGSDSNNGLANSSGGAFLTINRCGAVMAAGDTCHVQDGTYTTAVSVSLSGTSGARVRYVSDNKWGAKISTTGSSVSFYNSGDYVDIDGFDITGNSNHGILNDGGNVRALNNFVHDIAVPNETCTNGGAGIDHGNYLKTNNDTIGNVIVRIGDIAASANKCAHGIYHANNGGKIQNNIVGRTGNLNAVGIQMYHASTNVIVTNNTLFNNNVAILIGASTAGVTNDNTYVANNIMYSNTRALVETGPTGTNNVYTNNLMNSNGTDLQLQNGLTATNTVTGAPSFVNYVSTGSGDYHIQSGSPAKDAGISTNAPSTDIEGTTRPQGAGYDIGAYELSAGGGGGSCAGVINLRNQATGSATTGTTVPVTIPTPAVGSLLTAQIASDNSISSISGGGVTWTQVVHSCGHVCTDIWQGPNSSGSGTSITVTVAAATIGTAVNISEWGGAATASPLDTTGTITNGASTTPATLTDTPSADNGMVLGVAGLAVASGSLTAGPTNSFTGLTTASTGATYARALSAYKLQTTAAATSVGWTWSASASWDAVIASFKSAAGVCTLPRRVSVIMQ